MDFNVRQEYLFQQQDFIGHSGKPLTWKIECDAIQDVEWATLAHMIQELERRPFGEVVGIPRGGLKLSGYLNEYSTQNPKDPYLIVDDVLTTGGSMEEFKEEHFKDKKTVGWVVFARRKPADWINALFQMPRHWVDDPTKPEYNK